MCKWIKDILFPTNVFGKKIKTFTFPHTHPPYNSYNYDIEWTGERLEFTYTQSGRSGGKVIQIPHRITFENGNNTEENVFVKQTQFPSSWASDLYLKCTNVTKLIVNGEQLI